MTTRLFAATSFSTMPSVPSRSSRSCRARRSVIDAVSLAYHSRGSGLMWKFAREVVELDRPARVIDHIRRTRTDISDRLRLVCR